MYTGNANVIGTTTTNEIIVSTLTSTRVPFVDTDKSLTDASTFTFTSATGLVKAANPYLQITGHYTGANEKITFNCLKCGHYDQNGQAFPLSKGRGCYTCGRKVVEDAKRTPEEDFLKRIGQLHPKIKVLGKYQSVNKRIHCSCNECGSQWSPLAGSLLAGHGCASCSNYGFHPNRPSSFYVLEISYLGVEYIGFGITEDRARRIASHKKELHRAGASLLHTISYNYDFGWQAKELENAIKQDSTINTQMVLTIPGFLTESMNKKDMPKLLAHIERYRKWNGVTQGMRQSTERLE
jgi:hypothetical protein